MRRNDRFRLTNMQPADRRREAIAILSRGLSRLHSGPQPGAKEYSRLSRNRPCFPGEKAAQCDSNTAPPPEVVVSGAEKDEVAR